MLRLSKNIRSWTSFLLVVYLFLATPVSVWHSCITDHSLHETHKAGLLAIGKNGSKLCKVCDHHYDTFINEPSFEPLPVCICFNVQLNVNWDDKIVGGNFSNLPNKGPPAIC